MSKRLIFTIATFLIIGVGAAVAVLLTKGYSFSTTEGKVVGTGIIALTSNPDGASVYIDGHLTTATNTTISQLSPKTYDIKIVKEGYISWEKQVDVREGLVSEVKATLFPSLPTVYPLTFNGVYNPLLSPDGQKLAFAVPESSDSSHLRQTGGIWVWTMIAQPISFSRGAEPHQIVTSTPTLDFSKATLKWSPDSKQVLVTLQENGQPGDANQRNYLLPADSLTQTSDLKDITPIVAATLKSWETDQATRDQARLATIQDPQTEKIASNAAYLKWSPDETEFIVGTPPTPDKTGKPQMLQGFKVYDLSPFGDSAQKAVSSGTPSSGNQVVTSAVKTYDLPPAYSYSWLSDSKHIVMVLDGKIGIADFDGTNVAIIYAGTFEPQAVFSWPDASRLVILNTYPTPTGTMPNFFGINLK
ncbi:PEGA domain-containing protein [Patescibacteria group bacterium]|nr:PEGA domain-containing protein [Patescibacteria group bacterium]